MAKNKKDEAVVHGLRAAVTRQEISETLETNYMPYAMSVIVSRAIPEIDGFKPSHRKLLYTMYLRGLLPGNRTKNIILHLVAVLIFIDQNFCIAPGKPLGQCRRLTILGI